MHSGHHAPALVALAVTLAVFASFAALDIAGRARRGRVRGALWAAAAGLTFGLGTWAMHFVGMLSFRIGVPVGYLAPPTYLSIAIGVVGAVGVFLAAHRWRSLPVSAALGGLLGAAMVTKHYVGMEAMTFSGTFRYDVAWGAAAIAFAVVSGAVIVPVAFRDLTLRTRMLAAGAIGIGMWSMHHAGMVAARFEIDGTDAAGGAGSPELGMGPTEVAVAIGACCFVSVALALLRATADKEQVRRTRLEIEQGRDREYVLTLLHNKTPVPLHSVGGDGSIAHVSDAWTDLLGYTRREVVGRRFEDFLDPASRERYEAAPWVGETRRIEGLRAVSGDGTPVSVSLSERSDIGGRERLVLCIVEDDTARRRTESLYEQSVRMNSLGQLTGGVARDFNNVLAVVMGNLELMAERLEANDELAGYADNAAQAAHRGTVLTKRLLAFARRGDVRPASVGVEALIGGMTELLTRSLGPSISFETYFGARLPAVFVDAHALETAVLNLAANARDAMPDGGTIAISARRTALDAGNDQGLPPDDYVAITVVDNGSGMDRETLRLAREAFYTTKGLGRSTGLGLTVVHAFAVASGGSLDIRSEPGRGTSVTVMLPAAKGTAVATVAETTRTTLRTAPDGPPTVLLVEDDPIVLAATADMLRSMNHTVVETSSAEEALAALRNGTIVDVVLTDDAMPGMGGTALAREITDGWPDLPVVIVSGYVDGETIEAAFGGRVLSLQKPFGARDMATILDAAVPSVDRG